ncbi:MAG: TonB family protein [Nitrospira sp.]|nr:TonB family protein [Nitrospira sp.]
MTTLNMTYPHLERDRLSGWVYSIVFHSLMAVCTVTLLTELRLPPIDESFTWNVAMVAPPLPTSKVEPQPDPRHKPAPHKPTVAPQRVVQELRPVQQVVQRQIAQVVRTASPVTTVNQTAAIITHAVQQQDVEAKSFTPVATQQHLVQEDSTVSTSTPVTTESTVTRPVAQTIATKQVAEGPVERPSLDTVADRTALQTQHVVTRPAAEPTAEHTAPEPLSTPSALPQQIAAVQAAPVRATPATKADYGWLTKALLNRVEELKNYPHLARLNRWEGKVVLRAVIQEDGEVLSIDVQESSGRSILDDAAIETLRKASPLKLEHPLGKPQIAFLVPISYSLRR